MTKVYLNHKSFDTFAQFFFEAKDLSFVDKPVPLSAQMPCQRFKANAAKGITAAIGASLEALFFVKKIASDTLCNKEAAIHLQAVNVNQLNKFVQHF